MAVNKKKQEGLPSIVKYLLAVVIVVGLGYGGMMASKANKSSLSSLRNSCGYAGGGGGLTSFGSCR